MNLTCPDLRKLYRRRLRVRNEVMERRAHKRDDPWDLIAPGKSGFVAPWGPGKLVACTHSWITTNRILKKIAGSSVIRDGQDGQTVMFKAEHMAKVARILQLRKRRVVSLAQRKVMADRLNEIRPPAGKG